MELSHQANLQRLVNVNTDDIQKVVLQTTTEINSDIQQSQQQSQLKDNAEIRSPIQQIIQGKEADAKKDLLKDFIQKVASTGSDILTSSDTGRKDSGLLSDLKLLFGAAPSAADEVTISAGARMSQLTQAVGSAKADRAKISEATTPANEADQAQNQRGLENHLSTDHNSIRSQIQKLELNGDNILQKTPLLDASKLAGNMLDKMNKEIASDETKEGGLVQENSSTGLSKNQRVLGLSDEGTDSDDRSDKKDQSEQVDKENLEGIKKVLKDLKAQANASEVDEPSFGSNKKIAIEGKDKDNESEEKVDADKRKDDDLKAAQGGRMQVSSSGDHSSGSGGGDQGRDREEKVDTSIKRSKYAEEKDTRDDAIEKYTQSLRSNLISNKKDLFAVGKQEESLLKQYGTTSQQLKDIQLAVKKSVKEEIRSDIKDAIINKQLSLLNPYDSAAGDARLNKFTDYFVKYLLLGGQDFANFDEGFQGLINKAMYYASKDLADFAIDELGQFVISTSMDPSKDKAGKIHDFEQKVSDLNKITNNPKITEEWAQTAMEAMMKNLGLAKEIITVDPSKTMGMSVNVNTGDSGQQQQQRQKHGYEYQENDEKDIFINRLRALYLQRAVSPGLRTTLDTEFKIRKLKNGLMKLGVYTDVLNDKIQKEAELVAKDNILDMLREALEERSTLYELKGPAYSLIEHKIKGILKNADKAGIKIDKAEFNKLRDESNQRMFEITRKEAEMIGVRLSEMDLPQLVVRHREMMKLMSRLKEESSMTVDLPSDNRYSVISIVETA